MKRWLSPPTAAIKKWALLVLVVSLWLPLFTAHILIKAVPLVSDYKIGWEANCWKDRAQKEIGAGSRIEDALMWITENGFSLKGDVEHWETVIGGATRTKNGVQQNFDFVSGSRKLRTSDLFVEERWLTVYFYFSHGQWQETEFKVSPYKW